MKRYDYVGPEEIRSAARQQPCGAPVSTPAQLRAWIIENGDTSSGQLTATFVISASGTLHLADRHSEHIACSGGHPVLSAGEITLRWRGEAVEVATISNLSTGFCPEPASWPAVAAALAPLEVDAPELWTDAFIFRRCPACGQRNVVKDGWFVCAVCDADLPEHWNFDR